MRKAIVVIVVVVASVGCMHNHQITEIPSGTHVEIETTDGVTVGAEAEQAADGLVFHLDTGGDLGLANVATAVQVKRGRGALQGAGIGLVAGVVGGVVLAIIGTATDRGDGRLDGSGMVIAGAAGGGIAGSLIGALIGVIRGSRDVYGR